MEYANHFQDVMSSSEFCAFRKHWVDTFSGTGFLSKPKKGSVLVIGAGITGLTTAVRLALNGFNVKILSKEFAPKDVMAPGYVSTVAGALWEYPPGVCGRHRNEVSVAKSKLWALTTYDFLKALSELPGDHGVTMKTTLFYMRFEIADRKEELQKMYAYAKYCQGFDRGLHLVDRENIGPEELQNIKDCYEVICPVIDTNRYLLWLHLLGLSLGIKFYEGEVNAPLQRHETQIQNKFGVDVIANCSGLGSLKLVPDPEVYPLRGALIRVWNDGQRFPIVTKAHAIGHDIYEVDKDGKPVQDMILLVPRGKVLLMGGIVEEDEWDTSVSMENHPPFQDMLHRCHQFMPALKQAEIIKEEPIRIGLRPGHTSGVQIYTEAGTQIIHSYGHGGSGYSFSIGSANEVLMRAQKLVGQHTQIQSHL